MKKIFKRDRFSEIQRYNRQYKEVILTEEKLTTLPKVVQKHFRLCGFVGQPLAMNADIVWKESFIKLKPNLEWKALETLQFNSVNPLMRTAFMKVKKMFFEGKDLYLNGQGTMKGKILNLFSAIDAKGKEISQSALITSFAEMMLLSGYAFQDYMRWNEIDEYSVEAQLTDHNFVVTGIFHFDGEGKFKFFETNDRYFDNGNGHFEKKKFIARVNSYKKTGSWVQPESMSVLWVLEGGEFEYFKGTIEEVRCNVRQ